MRAVSDSTPLIFLAKIGKLHLLRSVFEEVLIPEEVYNEVVLQGEEYPDAALIEESVKIGTVKVKRAKPAQIDAPIEEGEKAAIALALREKIDDVLIDEGKVRRVAKILGLKPKGTIWILSALYEKELISKEELRGAIFDLIAKGYRMRKDILASLLRELE